MGRGHYNVCPIAKVHPKDHLLIYVILFQPCIELKGDIYKNMLSKLNLLFLNCLFIFYNFKIFCYFRRRRRGGTMSILDTETSTSISRTERRPTEDNTTPPTLTQPSSSILNLFNPKKLITRLKF